MRVYGSFQQVRSPPSFAVSVMTSLGMKFVVPALDCYFTLQYSLRPVARNIPQTYTTIPYTNRTDQQDCMVAL